MVAQRLVFEQHHLKVLREMRTVANEGKWNNGGFKSLLHWSGARLKKKDLCND